MLKKELEKQNKKMMRVLKECAKEGSKPALKFLKKGVNKKLHPISKKIITELDMNNIL